MGSGGIENAGLEGAVGSEGDQAGAFREVIVFAVGAGVAAVAEKHLGGRCLIGGGWIEGGEVVVVVVAAEGSEKTGLAQRLEHSGVEFRAADGFAEGAGEGGSFAAGV